MSNSSNKLLSVVETYDNYKELFKSGRYAYSDFINAAFIAFLSQDYGFSSEHKLTREFVEDCTKDMYFLLNEGSSLFPKENVHFEFWAEYFRHILDNGVEPDFSYYFYSGVLEAGIWADDLDLSIEKYLQSEQSYKNKYLLSLI